VILEIQLILVILDFLENHRLDLVILDFLESLDCLASHEVHEVLGFLGLFHT
jgi:hypothetical protein